MICSDDGCRVPTKQNWHGPLAEEPDRSRSDGIDWDHHMNETVGARPAFRLTFLHYFLSDLN